MESLIVLRFIKNMKKYETGGDYNVHIHTIFLFHLGRSDGGLFSFRISARMACYDSEYEFRRRQRSQCFYAQHTRWNFYHRCRCFCLIWIVVRLWLGIDKFEEPQDSGSLREDIVEIFDALLTPIPRMKRRKKQIHLALVHSSMNFPVHLPRSRNI